MARKKEEYMLFDKIANKGGKALGKFAMEEKEFKMDVKKKFERLEL